MARCKIQGEQENINPTNDVRNRHPLLLKAHSTDCTPQKKTLKLPTLEGDRPLPRYSPFYDDKPDKSGYYHSPMKDELYMQRVEPFDTFNNNILLIAASNRHRSSFDGLETNRQLAIDHARAVYHADLDSVLRAGGDVA